ncbi:hypothetical protein COCSUDRAFT_53399 [Coccomyxa subellipsoidea C-169]|uniref:Uncharacterized protein n=1 Tax=Coccomyxa subellipsoidea (strain C-169) TaxID=574566 RepID=I0YYW9_COCSC|nr:hypothetical protein COCSUDRAFT_53399 [Coccomyxa subellipsoidea C-169]EIE23588.1 hypothetical protein COCSUDRAFT_53399 [Coccomyxa subellipsoidea C-169]|eukprot:XP_005648132.1 hypothetical protein COCSUDRAFT_53399 [Coccomyxa subellipsoidea C-169]
MITRLSLAMGLGPCSQQARFGSLTCSSAIRPQNCLKMHRMKSLSIRHLAAPHNVRCMASSRNNEEKSWSEIAKDAAELAASAVSKVGKSISSAVRSLVPQEQQQKQQPLRPQRSYGRSEGDYGKLNPWERERGSLGMGDGLVGGLLGRAAGAMLGGAMRQLQNQQEQAEALREHALRVMQSDSRLRSRLGGSISPAPGGSSTSTSSQYINGRSTTTTTLQFFVRSSSGQQGLASVQQTVGDTGSDVIIKVQLPNGQVIQVDGSGSDGVVGGDVIDVEVRDVR